MKKIVSLLLGMLMLLSGTVTAYAAETRMTTQIAVHAKAEFNTGLPEFPVENGEGGGTLPDGTEIRVTDAPDGAVRLVVRQIAQTETEPYVWFRQVLSAPYSAMQAYEIYFLDANNKRLDANGATVKVTEPAGLESVTVYSVRPESSYQKLQSGISGGKVQFGTDGSRYYVLVGPNFEDYRDEILEKIDDKHEKNEDDVRSDRIDQAYEEAEDYEYDPDKSYDENREELDRILEELDEDLEDLEKFEDYRDIVLDKTDGLHKDGETDRYKQLIDKVYSNIENYEYDFDKTLQQNKDAIYKMLDELCKKLDVKTPYVPKTGDSSNILFWACTAGISLLMLWLLLLLLFKRRKEENEA